VKYILKILSTFRDFLWRATGHWVSAIGVALSSLAAISFLAVLAIDLAGLRLGNYTGIISYVILPTIFVVGLVMIPIGLRLKRKRDEKRGGQPTAFPVLNFNDPRLRSVALLVIVLTVVNLMIVSTASFKAVEVMDTDAFCGTTCHNVMQPEAVAHQLTNHSNVACVDCHIGEGAVHYARAKLRGATQMLQFISGDVHRPVPEPTEVPTAICTRCHATERFSDDRLHIRRMFSDKEKAVESFTIYRTLIGGFRDGKWQGIHQHNGMKIRYLADPKRRTITDIEVTRADGSTDRFTAKDVKAPAGAEWFDMGCTDCHSRPAHQLATPERVVDGALASGAIDKSLPFIKREGVAVLKASYPSQEEAKKSIPAALVATYSKLVPTLDASGKAKVEAAGKVLAEDWTENNFPDMKVTWGTYTDFLQHDPGCFRCHDSNHQNVKGQAVQKRCSGACHEVISTDEEKPEAMDVLYP